MHRNKAGYTLLEVTVALSIFLILMAIGSDYVIRGFRSITFAYEMEEAVKNARNVINRIIKEVRKSNTGDCGDYLLDQVNPQSFSFYSDIDSDGLSEKVRYYLENNQFKKGVIKPTGSPLTYAGNETVSLSSDYINNQAEPIFYYYDTNNNALANPTADKSSIRMIRISLKINVTPEIAPNDYYVDTYIQIRNLKDNL